MVVERIHFLRAYMHKSDEAIASELNKLRWASGMGGKGSLRRVYVVADRMATPCGGCRSVMGEFGTHDTEVIVANPEGVERRFALTELLPVSFELGDDPAL